MAEIASIRKRLNNPKRQLNPQLEESVLVRITLDANAALGERELRLETPSGLSNPIRPRGMIRTRHHSARADRFGRVQNPLIIRGNDHLV